MTETETTTAHLWEGRHEYYCEERNYYSNDTVATYDTWPEFFAAHANDDMDYNLLFRWDWRDVEGWEPEDLTEGAWPREDDHYRGYNLTLNWMGQRKGLYRTSVVSVCRADEPAVRAFLQPRLDHLLKLWAPMLPAVQP